MTNNEKIKQIVDYLDEYVSRLMAEANSGKAVSSAEWIYRKGQCDALKRVDAVITDIVSQK